MKKAGLAIAILVAMLLAASAIDKLSGSVHSLEMTGGPPRSACLGQGARVMATDLRFASEGARGEGYRPTFR